jgi:hypothetical protein
MLALKPPAALLLTLTFLSDINPAMSATGSRNPSERDRIVVFRDATRYTTFPDVKKLPDGRLLCVFRDASFPERVRHIEADARIVGCLSTDHGRSWSKPKAIYDDPHCQNDPSFTILGDGRLLMNFFNWVGRSEEYVEKHKPPFARRVDRGEWGAFAEPGGVHLMWGTSKPLAWSGSAMKIAAEEGSLYATSSSVLQTRKGTLLLPIYGRSVARMLDQAYVMRSTDGGGNWGSPIEIAVDPAGKVPMQEPALAQAKSGAIVAMLRTGRSGDFLYMTRSMNDGLTWATPEKTQLVGHPADLQLLPNGDLLVVYGYRHKPMGVRACVSHDDGTNWDISREIVLVDTGDHADLGYPSACLTDDRRLLVVYYINEKGSRDRWIECQRIELSDLKK